jgi:hypothetical protein
VLYLRLAHGGGVVEVLDADDAIVEDEKLVLKTNQGRVICRFERLDVLAYSARPEMLDTGGDEDN